jgi:large subunit ribosomal protein L22
MKRMPLQSGEVYAIARYVRVPSSKVRRVLKQIEGKSYKEALVILKFLPYVVCQPIIKVLCSAHSNAVNNKGLGDLSLVVKSAFVNQGPTMKNFRARAKGKSFRILKRTSHVTVILSAS